MKVSESKIRAIVRYEIQEQFTIPKHSKHSNFEMYAEEDRVSAGSSDFKNGEAKLKKPGSGFLIARIFPNSNVRFLGLVAPKAIRDRKGGTYDIPKGKLKVSEPVFQGAVRECEEESGIFVSAEDVIGKPIVNKNLTIFLASTNQDPKILPNPDSGIIEHEGFKWLSRDEMESLCLDYLKPIVKLLTSRFYDTLDKS